MGLILLEILKNIYMVSSEHTYSSFPGPFAITNFWKSNN